MCNGSCKSPIQKPDPVNVGGSQPRHRTLTPWHGPSPARLWPSSVCSRGAAGRGPAWQGPLLPRARMWCVASPASAGGERLAGGPALCPEGLCSLTQVTFQPSPLPSSASGGWVWSGRGESHHLLRAASTPPLPPPRILCPSAPLHAQAGLACVLCLCLPVVRLLGRGGEGAGCAQAESASGRHSLSSLHPCGLWTGGSPGSAERLLRHPSLQTEKDTGRAEGGGRERGGYWGQYMPGLPPFRLPSPLCPEQGESDSFPKPPPQFPNQRHPPRFCVWCPAGKILGSLVSPLPPHVFTVHG